jgi:Mrp family chromosome partitioning ATPase
MTKIYEALEHAGKARHGATDIAKISLLPVQASKPLTFEMEEEMLLLYKAIESLLPSPSRKIIQFIGSRKGEGTSTVIRELALLAATKIGKSVLLLDADRFHPTHQRYFDIEPTPGWQDAIKNYDLISKAFHQIQDHPLFVSPSANSYCSTPEIFDSITLTDFWKNIWERFELILIDSPPLATSPDGLAIAPKVHGVVIVLEAEKTRWTVAKNIKERIGKVGGNVLGIVLNKRQYHIPQFIYDRL